MRPHQSFCLYANTSLNAGGITPQLKLRIKFYCSWNWCFFFPIVICLLYYCGFFIFIFIPTFFSTFYTINFTITILSSLLSPPSLSLFLLCYNPLVFFPITLSALLIHSPHFSSSPNQTTFPFYTLTTCWPTYCTNFTQPQPPIIPDTSTLPYNRNTPKHTQGPQNPAAPILLLPLTHSTSCLPF
jgi:hypothetical protein